MDKFEKRCTECTELVTVNGSMCCKECFNQKCSEIDDCPLDITIEEVEEADAIKTPKNYTKSEVKERKKTVRERKPDESKRVLIQIFKNALEENSATDVTVTNIEREIEFMFDGRKFKLTLSAPRAPKEK